MRAFAPALQTLQTHLLLRPPHSFDPQRATVSVAGLPGLAAGRNVVLNFEHDAWILRATPK